jgi:hypothetical protein
MRAILRAGVLGIVFTLACATSTSRDSAPRFEIVDREQARMLNGDIAYYLILGWRERGGAYHSERIRVSHMTFMRLQNRADACLTTAGVGPCL